MSTTDRELLREAIRRTLVNRSGSPANASAVAGATSSTWLQVSARLAPVIGERGVDVLFTRALHLTTTTYPWLEMTGERNGSPLATFRTRLETQDASAAAQASQAVLVTFAELLATLIGASLSERLLSPIWATPAPTAGQETGT
jgi:hypothetical protein